MFATGTRLGPYEIAAPIGAGGMGEVYRARDTKLDRDVALKILPELFASDPERLARFEREARTLAALNHPHIAQIHGFEESGGVRALVMELVDGEDLAVRLSRGAIPLDEALAIAKQIAHALEAAHEQGIIHRDLKPANIKVRPDGTVKVLDFGLAKALDPTTSAAASATMSPTISLHATRAGVILGTAAYMSPEQARGKSTDRAADIWAFGAVLYELLTGTRAFAGNEITDVLIAVMTKEPDFSALPAGTPPAIRRLLRRCLRRDRHQRLQDAATLRIEIEDVLSGAADAEAAVGPARAETAQPPGRWRSALVSTSIAVLAVVAAGASFIAYRATRPVARPPMHFTDDVGSPFIYGLAGPSVAIARDGTRVAYVAQSPDGQWRIYVRLLEQSAATMLAGTEGGEGPFFSHDGRWIGFFVGPELKKISVEGGAAVTICDTGGNPRGGGFWDRDNTIYFANMTTPVLRVPAAGGNPTPVMPLGGGEVTNRAPQMLPGRAAILFEATSDNNAWHDATIQVYDLETKQRKTLVSNAIFGRYVHGLDASDGHLLYMQGDTLFAAPMDARRLELTGTGLPILQDVATRVVNGLAHLAVAESGAMVYIVGTVVSDSRTLAWVDSGGTVRTIPAPPKVLYRAPRISPDGKRVAVLAFDEGAENVYVAELESGRMTRLTFVKRVGSGLAWAPDGKHIAFTVASSDLKGAGVYWIRSDGAGEPQLLAARSSQSLQSFTVSSFSPDGSRLAYTEAAGGDSSIWTLPLDLADPEHPKAGKPELFLKAEKAILQGPTFSPDGRWLAYSSGTPPVPATRAIFVRPFPGPRGQWQVSNPRALAPIWPRDGRKLFYASGTEGREIMFAPYTATADSFAAGQPQVFLSAAKSVVGSLGFDVAADGQRVLAVVPSGADAPKAETRLRFLLNFADELKRKVLADQ